MWYDFRQVKQNALEQFLVQDPSLLMSSLASNKGTLPLKTLFTSVISYSFFLSAGRLGCPPWVFHYQPIHGDFFFFCLVFRALYPPIMQCFSASARPVLPVLLWPFRSNWTGRPHGGIMSSRRPQGPKLHIPSILWWLKNRAIFNCT